MTPRDRLRESLRENSAAVAAWPADVRAAIDTREIFAVAAPTDKTGLVKHKPEHTPPPPAPRTDAAPKREGRTDRRG